MGKSASGVGGGGAFINEVRCNDGGDRMACGVVCGGLKMMLMVVSGVTVVVIHRCYTGGVMC